MLVQYDPELNLSVINKQIYDRLSDDEKRAVLRTRESMLYELREPATPALAA